MHKPEISKIKKIFYDFSFIKEPMSIKRILDEMRVNPTESMKHILCRMQNNEDLDFLFNDVIKLIDTREVNLKFYTNLYLKVYTKNNPIRQLLCVNTFLKDLSDKSEEIKKSTLKVIESIKDEVILSNYNLSKEKINKMNYKGIEKMCMMKIKGNNKIKGNIREINRNGSTYLNNNNPPLYLKNNNPTPSLNNTPSLPLPPNINSILDLINRNSNNPKSLYFLIKLVYLNNLKILNHNLHSNYLPLFFYSSLISNDKQSIYNLSLLFLKSSYEKVYHILLFQESLLDFVDYENSNYLIYEEDPFFIKTQKVKMLFYKLDDISIYELTRQSKGELREVILENGIKKGYVIEGVFYDDKEGSRGKERGSNLNVNNNLNVDNNLNVNLYIYTPNLINILFNNFPFSLNYSYLIKNYLLNLNPLTLNLDSFKKYLFLVGKVCDDYEILDLDLIQDPSLINPILKFYISFFKRKILSEEKFIEIIRGLKKKEKFKEKAKILLNLINLKGPYVLFDFEEECGKEEEGKGVKLEIYEEKKDEGNGDYNNGDYNNEVDNNKVNNGVDNKDNYVIDNPLLTCKPYNPINNPINNPFDSLPSLKDSLNNSLHFNNSLSFNNFKKEDWSFNDNLLYSPSGDLIIDTPFLKGTLSLTKEDIKLEIDILEKPLKIKFGIEELKNEVKINLEEIIILKKIELKDIDKKFRIKIELQEGNDKGNDRGNHKYEDKGNKHEDEGNHNDHINHNHFNHINNYEILIDKLKLISPFDCTKSLFETEFKRIKNYKIIEKLDEKLVKKIDLNSFAFKILKKIVYGKNFCDQVVIKGEKEVMEIF